MTRRRALAHVGKEGREVVSPAFADRNAARAPQPESFVGRFVAAAPHADPAVILRRVIHAVSFSAGARQFSGQATATLGDAEAQTSTQDSFRVSAVTAAEPNRFRPINRWLVVGAPQYNKASEPTTSQVYRFRHVAIIAVAALVGVVGIAENAQGQGTLVPFISQYFNDASGNPVNNGKLCSYAAGTPTLLATYSNIALTSANANPIRTSSNGRPTTGAIYLTPGLSYKFELYTAGSDNTCSTGTLLWSLDNVPATPTAAGNVDLTDQTAGEALAAGDIAYLSDGSGALTAGRWYKADADNTYSSSTAVVIGAVPVAIASGSTGSIRVQGRITGLSGLTAGELYYVSATAGGLTATPPTNQWLVGKAPTTTTLVLTQNQGGVRLPDTDGTHSLVFRNAKGIAADEQLAFSTGGFNRPLIPGGRLTLTTGVPVTTADVTAAGTLYYTPYSRGGAYISLYDGTSAWSTYALSEISIAVPAATSQMYDVFVYDNAGTPTLELTAWTNDTTRATALTTQNGMYVKTGATTRLYVGSFRTTAVANQTEDSFAKRYVYNYYNRVMRGMRVLETADSWTDSGSVYAQANNNTANQLDFVIGVAGVLLQAQILVAGLADTAGDIATVAVGIDSTTAPTAPGYFNGPTQAQVANLYTLLSGSFVGYVAVGRHIAVWLERSGNTWTFIGDNGDAATQQSGIYGWMEM
jgi:hypothetical protein